MSLIDFLTDFSRWQVPGLVDCLEAVPLLHVGAATDDNSKAEVDAESTTGTPHPGF